MPPVESYRLGQSVRSQSAAALPDQQARVIGASPPGVDGPGAAGAAGGEEGFSFWDMLDVVNPLQHIPVVNKIYRAVTGDEIKPAAQVAGGTLYFGPLGFAAAAANAALEQETGRDALDHVAAALGFGGEKGTVTVQDLPDAPQATGQAAGAAQTAAPADAAALQAQQIQGLAALPGGSAAALAAGGVPGAAASGLPLPGAGGNTAAMAALMQGGGAKEKPQGMGLSQYRTLADAGGPQTPRSIIPPVTSQMARADQWRAAPTAPPARPIAAAAQTLDARTETAPTVDAPAAEPPAAASAQQPWPPNGPAEIPRQLIDDLMMANMAKYEALAKDRNAAGRR